MSEQVKTEPCLQGLTAACFRDHPDYAKRMFAYRLLLLLIGEELLRRLQKIPEGFFQRLVETLPDVPGLVGVAPEVTPEAPLATIPEISEPALIAPATDSAAPPIYIPPWEPGPVVIRSDGIEEDVVPDILKAKIDFHTAETHEIIAAAAGFKISIAALAFTVAGETNLTLKSGTTAVSGAMDFGGTNEPRGLTHGLGDYPLPLTTGEAFQITSSAAVQVSGYLSYYLSQ